MQRALVVTTGPELNEDLLEEAAAAARGNDCGVTVLSLISREEFEADVERLEAIGEVEHTHYGEDTVLDAERDNVRDAAEAIVDTDAVPLECHVSVAPEDEHVPTVLDVADRFDCDHLYLAGQKRSPTGKALFGDVTQKLLLKFPGYVTVTLE